MNTPANNTARPPRVALVVVFLAISFGVSLFRYIVAEQSYAFRFYFVFTLMLLLEGTIVWFILRGKNWARWALLAVFVRGVMSSWPDFLQRVHDYSASQVSSRVAFLIADVIILVVLFLPSSNPWFLRDRQKRRERQRRQIAIEAGFRQEYEDRLSATVDYWQRADIESEIAQHVKARMKLMNDANAA